MELKHSLKHRLKHGLKHGLKHRLKHSLKQGQIRFSNKIIFNLEIVLICK